MSLLLVKDSANNKLKQLECDSSGNLKVDKVDVSSLALESTLASMSAKLVACNTGNLALDSTVVALSGKVVACDTSGLSTSTGQGTANSHLSTLAGAVSAGVVQVSSGTVSAQHLQVFGTGGGSATVAGASTIKSTSFDINALKQITIFGSSTNTGDLELQVEVSHDNSTFYELQSHYISLDYTTGDFGLNLDCSARYVRLSRSNTGGVTESITAYISGK